MQPSATHTTVRFRVNGTSHEVPLNGELTLLDALREHLDLTGTKKGCDQGACGACTVLLDGKRRLSFLIPPDETRQVRRQVRGASRRGGKRLEVSFQSRPR